MAQWFSSWTETRLFVSFFLYYFAEKKRKWRQKALLIFFSFFWRKWSVEEKTREPTAAVVTSSLGLSNENDYDDDGRKQKKGRGAIVHGMQAVDSCAKCRNGKTSFSSPPFFTPSDKP